jgi:hypothetical protein
MKRNGYTGVVSMKTPINVKNIKSGRRTKSHEIMGTPERQMRFKIHVQKIT